MNELLFLVLGVALGARFDQEVKNMAPILKRPESSDEPKALSGSIERSLNV